MLVLILAALCALLSASAGEAATSSPGQAVQPACMIGGSGDSCSQLRFVVSSCTKGETARLVSGSPVSNETVITDNDLFQADSGEDSESSTLPAPPSFSCPSIAAGQKLAPSLRITASAPTKTRVCASASMGQTQQGVAAGSLPIKAACSRPLNIAHGKNTVALGPLLGPLEKLMMSQYRALVSSNSQAVAWIKQTQCVYGDGDVFGGYQDYTWNLWLADKPSRRTVKTIVGYSGGKPNYATAYPYSYYRSVSAFAQVTIAAKVPGVPDIDQLCTSLLPQ